MNAKHVACVCAMHVILHARLLGHQMHVIRMLRGRRMRDQDLSIPQPALPRWHRWHWRKPDAPRLARRLSRGREEAEARRQSTAKLPHHRLVLQNGALTRLALLQLLRERAARGHLADLFAAFPVQLEDLVIVRILRYLVSGILERLQVIPACVDESLQELVLQVLLSCQHRPLVFELRRAVAVDHLENDVAL